jgi:hypothetical protein
MKLQIGLTSLIILVLFFGRSCANSTDISETHEVFFQSSSAISPELSFTIIPDSRLYVAHTSENHWNYGSALDIDGDTFFMNGSIWCKYVDDISETKLLNLSDPNQLYLTTLDSNGTDTLFHYMVLTDRGQRLNVPKGKEYAVFVYHKEKGIVGLYLLAHPNRETNPTNKDVAGYVRGDVGFMDTSLITIYFPEQLSRGDIE